MLYGGSYLNFIRSSVAYLEGLYLIQSLKFSRIFSFAAFVYTTMLPISRLSTPIHLQFFVSRVSSDPTSLYHNVRINMLSITFFRLDARIITPRHWP